MSVRRSLTILGATGSVGQSTIDLVCRNPDRFDIGALTANKNYRDLADIARKVGARHAVISQEQHYDALCALLADTDIEVSAGSHAVAEAACLPADIVVSAIVGFAGLRPTLAALECGRTVALANKESLVCAGELVMRTAKESGARILPVDSEHNAIAQVLDQNQLHAVEMITLTASGGPFWKKTYADMKSATPEEALNHPNWSMGARISIDSATMMNKGLELIEAHYLFAVQRHQINVLVHPQSVVHGLVQYVDGSLLAQLASPDMRIPIAHCLSLPDRISIPGQRLNLAQISSLEFAEPDLVRFPALRLALEVLERGQGASAVLNAADEIAVAAFLDKRLGFTAIADVVNRVLDDIERAGLLATPGCLKDAEMLDEAARRYAGEACAFMEI
ncbi:MAG: 1-deoxy-D-xylulose-5-phosphate reductoisomerase [Stappiaceae bacterium]